MVRRIGRYEITGKLGDGGFGNVYRGYDPTVERVVAIKVLSTLGDASLISRFRTEAMTAGNLHHKNIVTIYEFGEDAALCDIWSFGVVFYELLTGVHPFRADDPAGVMYRVTMEEPPPVDSLVPECPPGLAANLHRLLSKDRQSRTQSLEDFLLDAE